VQEVLKKLSLVPRHEFEAQEALVTNLETKVRHLEQRLAEMEKVGATSANALDEN
jgi:BMFP domain-containing protein YqiC